MATKLYLRNTTAFTGGPSAEQSASMPNGSASGVPTFAVRDMATSPGSSQQNLQITHENENGVHRDTPMRAWVIPLAGVDITAQTWTFALTGSESNASANTFHNVCVYVWRPGTSSVVGYVYDTHDGATGGNREIPTTATGDVFTKSGSAVTGVQAGDLLVFEWWHHWQHSALNNYNSSARYDGANDPVDNVTDTTTAGSYISTPQDGILQVNATASPAVITAVTAVPTPTVTDDETATPAVITAVTALPTPTTPVDHAASPAVIAAVTTLPTPDVSTFNEADPAVFAVVVAFDVPLVVGEDNTPPPVAVVPGSLGCTEIYEVYITDRSGHAILVELPFTNIEWERVISDTSTATAEIKGVGGSFLSECCVLLEDVDAWKNELHIYRNSERIWAGPITGMDLDDDGATIQASDPSAWWARRRIHENHHHQHVDLGEIFAAYVSDAMSVDNVPDVTVAVTKIGRLGSRRVRKNDRKIARGEIDELSRSGLGWTVVNRQIILNPKREDIIDLRDDHFRGPASITVDGRMATEITVLGAAKAQGHPQVVGTARGADDVIDDYGVHEWVVTEDNIKDNESASTAADRRLSRFALPGSLFTGGDLDTDFPLDQNELIPGRRFNADLREQCRRVLGRYRATRIGGSYSQDTDTITMDVTPVGRGDDAL